MNAARRRFAIHPGVLAFLLGTAISGLAGQTGAVREKTSDEKIAFYAARIGGPGTYPAYARLGLAYLQKYRETGRAKYHDQGLRCLRQSLSYQRNFEALLGLAVGLSERHFFREALPYAEEAAATMPADIEAQGAVFDIHLALGNIPEAQRCLDAMLQAQTGFHSLCRQAALLEYKGDLAGALASMIKARDDAAPGLSRTALAWAEVRIGSLHVALCDAARAREAYDCALALVPGYSFAIEHLAEWHAAQAHWQEAKDLYSQLLKLRPNPLYRIGLAEACRQLGKTRKANREERKARTELRRAVDEGAQDQLRPLALLLLEQPDTAAEGLRWAERDWQVRPDALAADTIAWAYYCNGNGSEAVRLSDQALQSGTKNSAILLHGGLIRCQSGRDAEGRALLREALSCPLSSGRHERTLTEEALDKLSSTEKQFVSP